MVLQDYMSIVQQMLGCLLFHVEEYEQIIHNVIEHFSFVGKIKMLNILILLNYRKCFCLI